MPDFNSRCQRREHAWIMLMLVIRLLFGALFWWLATNTFAFDNAPENGQDQVAMHERDGTAFALEYFSAFDNSLGLGEIVALPDSAWHTNQSQTVGLGFEDRTVWFRTRLLLPAHPVGETGSNPRLLEEPGLTFLRS